MGSGVSWRLSPQSSWRPRRALASSRGHKDVISSDARRPSARLLHVNHSEREPIQRAWVARANAERLIRAAMDAMDPSELEPGHLKRCRAPWRSRSRSIPTASWTTEE